MTLSTSSSASSEVCCSPFLTSAIQPEEAEQLAAVMRVLGEPARLRLLSAIATRPNGEACVCELTEPLGLSQPTVSHHLKVLHSVGLVDRDRRGTWVYYCLVPERFEALQRALAVPTATKIPE